MGRLFLVIGVCLIAVFGAAMMLPAEAVRTVIAARPTSETQLFLRLNGHPRFVGAIREDAGVASVDAGFGEVVRVQCLQAACIKPGTSASCTSNSATLGAYTAAFTERYFVLAPDEGSVAATVQGDAGVSWAECNVWRMD